MSDSYLGKAFSTVTGMPSAIRLLFGAVILTDCAFMWAQILRLALDGKIPPIDAGTVAFSAGITTILTLLLGWARWQESLSHFPSAPDSPLPQPPEPPSA